jgi:predicted amidohydrolase
MDRIFKPVVLLFLILFPFSMNAQNQTREFKLAVVQMYVTPGDLQKNLSHATQLISESAAEGADIVLLPEVMDLGWTHPSAKQLAEAIPGGKAYMSLAEAARKNDVWVCCGIVYLPIMITKRIHMAKRGEMHIYLFPDQLVVRGGIM